MLALVTGGQAAAERSRAFRERARLEADRYGPDPWIFVRELLQNSRDAGANSVAFTVGTTKGSAGPMEWIACQDDGEGMTFEHARRYLFALYASSKEDRKNQAGKFGVGFWSILRFEPTSIIIRSCPRNGTPWTVRLDGSLERAEHGEPPTRPGTEIRLEKPRGDGRLEHRVFDAVWQSARYLHRRDDSEQPLPITINGRSANAEFALQAPSASFHRRSVRGVVGLGRAPRVELFCRGLRVRSAACLEDLIAPAGRHTARIRVQFPELPAGLAPVALLESHALEVLLSRSDARDGRALAKLVKLAQRELERLVERQLAFTRPLSWPRRMMEGLRSGLRESLAWRTVLGSMIGAAGAIVLSIGLWSEHSDSSGVDADPPSSIAASSEGAARTGAQIYEDLGGRYRGPRVDVLVPGSAEPVNLHYRPPYVDLYFAALTFPSLHDDGAPDHETKVRITGKYQGASCQRECVEVSLPLRGQGVVRIPVPSGHRIVSHSVYLDTTPISLYVTSRGHPAVDLGAGAQGTVRYQSTVAPDPGPPLALRTVPELPAEIMDWARDLRALPTNQRVGELLRFVRRRVAYDRSPQMAQMHSEAQARGDGFIARTLDLGKGDCDVQNGLLVALMQAAGVSARLAVGYLGANGRVLPWLHAWVEYRDTHGDWHIADASERSGANRAVAVGAGSRPEMNESFAGRSDLKPLGETTEQANAIPGDSLDGSAQRSIAVTGAKSGWSWPQWIGSVISMGLAAIAMLLWIGGRTRRAFKLDQSADLSRLLQGVLQQPGAFGAMSALLYRPLVPLVGSGAISLHRARTRGAKGRLFRSDRGSALAQRASRAGAMVLNTSREEGRAVADALGAIDLDTWDERLRTSWTTPLVDEVNRLLRQRRERWSLRVAPQVAGTLVVLHLDALRIRLPDVYGSRVVVLDSQCAWLVESELRYLHTPRAAVFTVLDQVVELLDLPQVRRAALLCEGARASILEAEIVGSVP